MTTSPKSLRGLAEVCRAAAVHLVNVATRLSVMAELMARELTPNSDSSVKSVLRHRQPTKKRVLKILCHLDRWVTVDDIIQASKEGGEALLRRSVKSVLRRLVENGSATADKGQYKLVDQVHLRPNRCPEYRLRRARQKKA